jgi:hypothetical protein
MNHTHEIGEECNCPEGVLTTASSQPDTKKWKRWEDEIGDCISTSIPSNFTRVKAFIHSTRQEAILEGRRDACDYIQKELDEPEQTKGRYQIVNEARTLPVTEK